MSSVAHEGRQGLATRVQGTRAGVVSRVFAAAVDVVLVFLGYVVLLWGVALVRALGSERHVHQPDPQRWVTVIVLVVLATIYLTAAWSASGRTPGDQLLGLRVVTVEGAPLTGGRAFGRALACVVFGWLGLCWLVGSRRNLALQDRACGTAVVYDWMQGARPDTR